MDVETAKKIFRGGEYLEQHGKIEEAIACYQQATKLYPECDRYHYKLGTILRQENKLDSAIQSFCQAISLNPEDSWSYHALGEVYTVKEDLKTAIEYYQKALALNSNFSWTHYNLGRIYHQQQDLTVAQNCYQTAIEIDPQFDWSHYFLAKIFAANKELKSAVYHYEKALELNSSFHEAYYYLGKYWQEKGELAKAVENYNLAISINPQEYNYYYHLSETLIQLDKFSETISCCERAIALQPNSLQSYFYLGKSLIEQGKNAIDKYRHIAKERSSNFQINLEIGLAQAWQKSEEFSQSIQCCQNAIKLDPTAKMSFKILQYISIDPEQLEGLIAFYQQIGRSNKTYPLLWVNLGDLLTRQEKFEEAIDCYHTSNYENAILKNSKLADLSWENDRPKNPDFIIIGATKCGTTSLFSYLKQHPQILLSCKKEIRFFDRNFHLGIPWYLAHFPTVRSTPEFITGEASPFYIYNEQAISRIKELLPEVKLIAMLRNPIERTISEYYHAANHGFEKRSLEKLIVLETEELANKSRSEAMQTFGYLKNSIYVEKIAKWTNEFPTKNILIIQSEDFFENTPSIMQNVYQFLGVPEQDNDFHTAYNVGTYSSVSKNIRRQLKDFFIPYNQELEQHLGRKFNW